MTEVAGTPSAPVTVEESGITITSTSETPEAIQETLQSDPVTDAASTLGKRSAEARKAKNAISSAEVDDGGDGSADGSGGDGQAEAVGQSVGKPTYDPKKDPRVTAKTRLEKALEVEKIAKHERDAAKAEAAALKTRLDALEKASRPAETPAKTAPEGKPQASDYATYDEWVDAVADWKVEEKFKQRETAYQQQEQVREYVTMVDGALGAAVAARKEYEKVDPQWFGRVSEEVKEVANKLSVARDPEEKLGADHVIADEVLIAGQAGPQVLLYLSEHPQEFQQLRAAKTPIDIQIGMRLIARQLNGSGNGQLPPSRPSVSQAKAPIRPVNGTPAGNDGPPGDDASFADHAAYWNRRDKVARR
jgi:hypothetical protein